MYSYRGEEIMHEIAIAKKIVEDLSAYKNIKAVTIEIGELAPITAEELEDALSALANWKLNIVKKESIVECECGYKGRAKIRERKHDIVIYECPNCGKIPEIVQGGDIVIKQVEIED